MFAFFSLLSLLVSSTAYAENLVLNGVYWPVDVKIVDMEYSAGLDVLVYISSSPNVLHVMKPDTGSESEVALNLVPYSVSVSPCGQYAVVGHDGWMSHVDLKKNKLLATIATGAIAGDVVYGTNELAYIYPSADQWVSAYQVNLVNETASSVSGNLYAGAVARLHPNLEWIYAADTKLSPSDFAKWGTDPLSYLRECPYHGDYPISGNLWYSADGAYIITRGGSVFYSTDDASTDMTYRGSLVGGNIVYFAASNHSKIVSTVHDMDVSQITTYDDYYYTQLDQFQYPILGNGTSAAGGKMLFYSADGDQVYNWIDTHASEGAINGVFVVPSKCLESGSTAASGLKSCYEK